MEEGYIERCLLSIIRQRYIRAEFEIIVSDARSTDRTAEIARRYADNVIVEDRKGIAYGRNVGAKKAKGEILVFVDADAILDQDFLGCCRQEFLNPAVIGITGIAKPNDGGILQRFVYRCTYGMVVFLNFLRLSLFPGICVAYRRTGFTAVKGFREDFGIVEDLDLSRRISHLGKCIVVKKAYTLVSTRRLEKNLIPTVLFHIYCDIKYLITGKAPAVYPKVEEIHSWRELWSYIH